MPAPATAATLPTIIGIIDLLTVVTGIIVIVEYTVEEELKYGFEFALTTKLQFIVFELEEVLLKIKVAKIAFTVETFMDTKVKVITLGVVELLILTI